MKDIEGILRRAEGALSSEDLRKLRALVETFEWLQGEIGRKHVSLIRLRKLLFGTLWTSALRDTSVPEFGEWESPRSWTEGAEGDVRKLVPFRL